MPTARLIVIIIIVVIVVLVVIGVIIIIVIVIIIMIIITVAMAAIRKTAAKLRVGLSPWPRPPSWRLAACPSATRPPAQP